MRRLTCYFIRLNLTFTQLQITLTKLQGRTKYMHNNQKYCEYRVKTLKCNHVTEKKLSVDIDVRPRNMVLVGNTVFQEVFR